MMTKEMPLMVKDTAFHRSRDLCFPVATPLATPGVMFKFLFPSSMHVSKHRMASRERT